MIFDKSKSKKQKNPILDNLLLYQIVGKHIYQCRIACYFKNYFYSSIYKLLRLFFLFIFSKISILYL